jgi:hypothetical protein
MLAGIAIGFFIGVMVVIGLIKLTMRTEPTPCLIVFGTMFCLIFLLLVIGTQWVLAK